MRAGTLRQKVEIFSPTTAKGADGSIEVTDASLGVFYASVKTEQLSDATYSDKIVSYVTHKIILRYNTTDLTGISGNAKIVVDGQTLHVLSATVMDYRDRLIEVIAEARI